MNLYSHKRGVILFFFTEKEILSQIKIELGPPHLEAVESLMNTSKNYVKVASNEIPNCRGFIILVFEK